MKKLLLLAAVTLMALPVGAMAQITDEEAAWLDLIRADIRVEKEALVRESMGLTGPADTAFWPLYAEYTEDLRLIWTSRVELIEAYAVAYEGMTEEVASELAEWSMDLDVQQIQLLKETFREMADHEDLGAIHAARFIQVESRIDLLVNLEITAALPILERPGGM